MTGYVGCSEIKDRLREMIANALPHTKLKSRAKLAEEFGSNKTTVDRAISELIGEGVLYAKDKSGTYVSELADRKSVAGSRPTEAWAVLIPNITDDTYPGIFRGIEDVALANGKYVMLCNTDNDEKMQNQYITKLLGTMIEGLIIIPAIWGDGSVKSFWTLRQHKIPFVLCNRDIYSLNAPCVKSNNFYGGYLATKHLIENGCKNIAYISGPVYVSSSERYQGYLAALLEFGIAPQERYVVCDENGELLHRGYELTRLLLTRSPEIDGIFCFNDSMAVNALTACGDMGRSVGNDIAVIGYDNTNVCEQLPVKLTSVDFQNYKIGEAAANYLLAMLGNSTNAMNKKTVLQPQLVIRQSCKLVR